MFNAHFINYTTQFIIFYTKVIILNATFIIFNLMQSSSSFTPFRCWTRRSYLTQRPRTNGRWYYPTPNSCSVSLQNQHFSIGNQDSWLGNQDSSIENWPAGSPRTVSVDLQWSSRLHAEGALSDEVDHPRLPDQDVLSQDVRGFRIKMACAGVPYAPEGIW